MIIERTVFIDPNPYPLSPNPYPLIFGTTSSASRATMSSGYG